MVDRLREAAQAALAFIDRWWETGGTLGVSGVRDQLRAALAEQEVEPAPEPVAWRWKLVPDGMWHYSYMAAPPPYQSFPLYTHPPRREWQGISDKEIAEMKEDGVFLDTVTGVVRFVEAMLKARNT